MTTSRRLDDAALERLRLVADTPDLTSTKYTIGRELGRGGMGTVYEAFDTELQRSVALKVVTSPEAVPAATTRLETEARTLARLEHPGIVPVHEMGTLPDGRTYYAMKLVRGRRLDDAARETPRAQLLRDFIKLCDAVAFAHANGVVHRDIKPQNIMVGAFGEVMLLDWSEVAGTRGFMAPEQEHGLADARSDVFALGRVLEWMYGLYGPPIPKRAAAIVARACSSSAAGRYESVSALAADVAALLENGRVSAYRESALERTWRFVRRYRDPILLVLAYLVLRVAFVLASR